MDEMQNPIPSPIHRSSQSSSQSSDLNEAHLAEFLKQGWILALGHGSSGADSARFVIGWGKFTWQNEPMADRASLYAPDFYLQAPQPWLISEFWTVVEFSKLQRLLASGAVRFENPLNWDEPNEDSFAHTFQSLQMQMAEGRLQKAVPAVFANTHHVLTPEERAAILLRLLPLNGRLRTYGLWTEQDGILGATPENLFWVEDQILRTAALAGTRIKPALDDEFLADEKERYEHELVAKDIAHVLSSWGEVNRGAIEVLELPQLLHLKTDFSVQLKQTLRLDEFVRALHPTPALGVAPRSLGLEFMAGWDNSCLRLRFGAPFGVQLPSGQQEVVVAIRNVQWQGGEIRLGSGCGVVPQSNLKREWQELAAKRDSVRKALGI
jgi:menaquinone-specific isochorismate synthase